MRSILCSLALLLAAAAGARGQSQRFYVISAKGISGPDAFNYTDGLRFNHKWTWYANFTVDDSEAGTGNYSWAGIVDSGSTLLQLACQGAQFSPTCNLTTQPPPTPASSNTALYSPSQLALLDELTCDALNIPGIAWSNGTCSYVAGAGRATNTSGYLFVNSFSFGGGILKPQLVAGCITAESGCSKGIIPLSAAPLSLATQISDFGLVSPTVSFCLTDVDPGSFVAFGSALPQNVTFQTAKLLGRNAPAVNGSGRYYLESKAIRVGAQSASVSEANSPTLVDTGTPGLLIPRRVLAELQSQLRNASTRIQNVTYFVANTSMGTFPCLRTAENSTRAVRVETLARAFPSIAFNLSGKAQESPPVTLVVSPAQYADAYTLGSNRTMLCARVSANPGPGFVLGAVAMIDKFVQVDPVEETVIFSAATPNCGNLRKTLQLDTPPPGSQAPSGTTSAQSTSSAMSGFSPGSAAAPATLLRPGVCFGGLAATLAALLLL